MKYWQPIIREVWCFSHINQLLPLCCRPTIVNYYNYICFVVNAIYLKINTWMLHNTKTPCWDLLFKYLLTRLTSENSTNQDGFECFFFTHCLWQDSMTTAATGRVHRLDARPSRIESRLQEKKPFFVPGLSEAAWHSESFSAGSTVGQSGRREEKVGGWVGGVEGAEC